MWDNDESRARGVCWQLTVYAYDTGNVRSSTSEIGSLLLVTLS